MNCMDLQHRIGLIVQGNMQCNSNEQHQVIRQTQTMNLEFRFSHFPFVRGFIPSTFTGQERQPLPHVTWEYGGSCGSMHSDQIWYRYAPRSKQGGSIALLLGLKSIYPIVEMKIRPPNELVVVGQADIRRYLKWKKKSELMALLISWVVYAWCGICILGFLN